MRKKILTPRFIAEAGIIAALYFVLTIINPLAFGSIQIRFSEALCILPFFTPAAVPGLFIGCLLSNLAGSPLGPYDIVFGSLATLTAAFITYVIGQLVKRKTPDAGKAKWLLPLPAVVINAFVIAAILNAYLPIPDFIVSQYGENASTVSYWLYTLYVGAGQAIACYVLGMPLFFLLGRYKQVLFKRKQEQ